MREFWALAVTCLFSMGPGVSALELDSGTNRVTLVELFTSEGCSSCPPADRWLSKLRGDSRLWKQVVPVAFHVDYWDYIGWPDRFADPAYTARQRNHRELGNVYSVYTPGFLVNGREWRGWFRYPKLAVEDSEMTGRLTANVESDGLSAKFVPAKPNGRYQLNFAVLGMGLTTEVGGGENEGKQLRHDFVVLELRNWVFKSTGNNVHELARKFKLPTTDATDLAVALWVSEPGSQQALQATGGLLSLAE